MRQAKIGGRSSDQLFLRFMAKRFKISDFSSQRGKFWGKNYYLHILLKAEEASQVENFKAVYSEKTKYYVKNINIDENPYIP